jgi:hypothetical protein
MSTLLRRNVSPRAALAVTALALAVTVVGGREASPPAPSGAPAAGAPARSAPALELDKLERPGLGEPLADPFAVPRPAPAAHRPHRPHAAVLARAAPAAPVAPPLPYRYLGSFAEGGRSAVYLARGDEHLLAEPGALLDGAWRVEAVTPVAVTLLHVPLGTRHSVPIPARD